MPAPAATTTLYPPPYDWATEFHAFTWQHLATLAVFFGLMAGSCVLGRRWRGQRRERVLRHAWIWSTFAWQSAAVVWYLLPAQFDAYESWPLHLCDIAAWVAPLALLTQRRWLRSLLYFWGVGLCTQAFITPVISGGHGEIRYWLFFVGHTQIVGSALYDMIALGYRPALRDWGVVTLITIAWLAVVTPINVLFEVNYGYTGNHPVRGTLLEYLGPWPWRIVSQLLAGQVACGLVYLPWAVAGWLEKRKAKNSKLT
jgi:hypothetical integral membrane protein (TIGR02206 family)